MQTIQNIQFYQGTREERLPGFAPEFPYIATRCEIGGDTYRFAPWHWHQAVELFVIQSGTLVYDTPARRLVFPPGSGGFVNSNVLHTTRPQQPGATNSITEPGTASPARFTPNPSAPGELKARVAGEL